MSDPNDKIISDLYQDSAQELPPLALDQQILDASISTKKKKHAWLYPLSTAAAVVLGMTFILNLPNQVDQHMQVESAPVIQPAPMPKKRKQEPTDKAAPATLEKDLMDLEEAEANSYSKLSRQEEEKKEQPKTDGAAMPAKTQSIPATESILGLSGSENDTDNLTLDEVLSNVSGRRIAQPQKPHTDASLENQPNTDEGAPVLAPSIPPSYSEESTLIPEAVDDLKPVARSRATKKKSQDKNTITKENAVLESRSATEDIRIQTKEKILQFWREGKFDAARDHLKEMKQQHPDLDWSELDVLILKAKN
ncbi:hypothetical protein [Marinicella sp. W31]|uniref:hypothetical protein n=1 Tax=Marinicella sp. W31 TaxID=3023713 RepID=UPI0037580C9F